MNMSACMGRGDAAFWLRRVMQQATDTYQQKSQRSSSGEADSLTRLRRGFVCV